MSTLTKEIETYNEHLSELLLEEGKYVVISGQTILGIFGTYEDALREAYQKCGLNKFLVKKIAAVEQIQFFTKSLDLTACPT